MTLPCQYVRVPACGEGLLGHPVINVFVMKPLRTKPGDEPASTRMSLSTYGWMVLPITQLLYLRHQTPACNSVYTSTLTDSKPKQTLK